MSFRIFAGVLAVSAVLASGAVLADESEYHFVVRNATKARITALEVSEDKKSWGNFDIGKGINAGASETLVWDESTDNEACEQWIRAKFSDGSVSEPSKQDFCKDLDTPIEFSE